MPISWCCTKSGKVWIFLTKQKSFKGCTTLRHTTPCTAHHRAARDETTSCTTQPNATQHTTAQRNVMYHNMVQDSNAAQQHSQPQAQHAPALPLPWQEATAPAQCPPTQAAQALGA